MKKTKRARRPKKTPKPSRLGIIAELDIGPERKGALAARAKYETTLNMLSGKRRSVRVVTIVRKAIDLYLLQNPPAPPDGITAALKQVASA